MIPKRTPLEDRTGQYRHDNELPPQRRIGAGARAHRQGAQMPRRYPALPDRESETTHKSFPRLHTTIAHRIDPVPAPLAPPAATPPCLFPHREIPLFHPPATHHVAAAA